MPVPLVVAKDHESVLYSQEVLVASRSGHEKQAEFAIAVDVSAPLNGQYRAIPYPISPKISLGLGSNLALAAWPVQIGGGLLPDRLSHPIQAHHLEVSWREPWTL
jgi:hypothetical protein